MEGESGAFICILRIALLFLEGEGGLNRENKSFDQVVHVNFVMKTASLW